MNGRGYVSVGGEEEAVRIWLLGGFRVAIGAKPVERNAWRLRKSAALIKLLALASGHRLHREQVMDLLWPELGKKAASNSLRNTLHAARKTLDQTEGSRYLASEDDSLILHPGGDLWVDVDAFEEAAVGARRSGDPAAYRAAINLYSGDLLPEDRYEEWAEGRRQELRHTWLSLHLELARAYEGRGEYEGGIEALQRAVSEEPTNEQMHAGLMRLYAFSGRRGEALAQYERLREALSGQLDAEVGATTERLREEIAAGRLLPDQPTIARTEEPYEEGKQNLPASRTSFVGREHEMREIERYLAMTRLLTLTGAGGSGKTRLALEVARDIVGAYPDGVWLAELASLSEGEFVAQTVAEAVGVHGQPGRSPSETLVEALRTKNMLLILDNCEHLVDAVAGLVASLLESCPYLRILATSREALGASGEVIWLVSLLSVPDLETPPTQARLEGYESIRLFVDRARQRAPAFALRPENAQAVAQICAHLEGLPLAIELAAARIKMLPPQALLDRLGNRLKMLRGGPREFSERQRTLRSTIEWSYALLEEGEKALFSRLSVFSGGVTLDAAEAVCDALGDLSVDALEGTSSLLEKSLLGQEEGTGGEPRFVMLETIREYAHERLEERRESEEVRQRHLTFFLIFAEEVEPKLRGPEDMEWLKRLEDEHDNLRAALSWALQRGETVSALRLAGALRMFWQAHGHFGEGRKWLETALAKDDQASVAVRLKALEALFWLTLHPVDFNRAQALAREAIDLSAEGEVDRSQAASLRMMLATPATLRGDYELAKELLEESLALSREANDKVGVAEALLQLAIPMDGPDENARVKVVSEEGIALCREIGYAFLLPSFLLNVGYCSLLEGDYERGAALNEEAAVLCRERGYKDSLVYALDNLGWAALLQGDHERARSSYKESLTLCKEGNVKYIASESLDGLACISAAEGDDKYTARLFGAAEALRESLREVVAYQHQPEEDAWREPYLATARSRLGEAAWDEELAQGWAMGMEAVEYALSKEEEADSPTTPASEEPSVSQPHAALTRREREVAALVAQGMSNRQLAQELSISERTAGNHVARILRKLGLRSRAQIGGWAAERQLRIPHPD